MRGKLWVAAIAVAGILLCVRGTGQAQEKEKAAGKKLAIRAGRLIDGKSERALTNGLLLIGGARIVSVSGGGTAPAGGEGDRRPKATGRPGSCAALAALR